MLDLPLLEQHVRAAQKRDHASFLAALELVRPALWARAWGHAQNQSGAEDLLQETYLRAYQNLAELRDPRAFSHWIMTILDRLAQRTRALVARTRSLSETQAEDMAAPVDAAAFLSLASADVERLRQALQELAAEDRQLLALRFSAGLNAPEIAAQLQISAGAVRVRLCRAIEKLRRMLGVRA